MESLKSFSIGELRQAWVESGARGQLPTLKRLAVRQVAWRLQSLETGDFDSETRRLLRAAVRDARVEAAAAPQRRPRTSKKPTRARDLPTGTQLVRKYRGRLHEVKVLENGRRFEYRGEVYDSLTQIAKEITGAHWSGPRFFGLGRVRSIS
jgi:hypothetical protein